MKLTPILLATTVAAATVVVAVLFAPARAQIHIAPQPQTMGIPCRISWEAETHGGDTLSAYGEAELTRIAPQGDGRFVAFGWGHGTVTYHSANGCTMVGSPWTAHYDVSIASEDGTTAQVDIGSDDDEHSVTATRCLGNADFQYDTERPVFREWRWNCTKAQLRFRKTTPWRAATPAAPALSHCIIVRCRRRIDHRTSRAFTALPTRALHSAAHPPFRSLHAHTGASSPGPDIQRFG